MPLRRLICRGCGISSVEPALAQFHQRQIDREQHGQKAEELQRQRHESQAAGDRRERKQHRQCDHAERQPSEPGVRMAAQRIAAGADDEDHQYLGGDGLDEPAGVEQGLVGLEQCHQQVKSQQVEQRADGANGQHEVADEGHVPAPRTHQILFIHVVQRQRQF